MIYFIQIETGPIKIGFASCVRDNPADTPEDIAGYEQQAVATRLSGIQVACPYECRLLGYIPGERYREGLIHKKFRHLRIRGEWHRPEPDLLEFIAAALHGDLQLEPEFSTPQAPDVLPELDQGPPLLYPHHIRAMRQFLGMTRTQLASKMEMSEAAIARWESDSETVRHPRGPAALLLIQLVNQARKDRGTAVAAR